MQFTLNNTEKPRVLRDSAMSIPNSIYIDKSLGKNLEIDSCYCGNDSENILAGIWNKQHPLIHMWLVLSSISICLLSALFFIFPG